MIENIDALITDRDVQNCCQNDISEMKTSNNHVKIITACPEAGVPRWLIENIYSSQYNLSPIQLATVRIFFLIILFCRFLSLLIFEAELRNATDMADISV